MGGLVAIVEGGREGDCCGLVSGFIVGEGGVTLGEGAVAGERDGGTDAAGGA